MAALIRGLKPCHYPNFVAKCVCCILARDSGRQSKAWGGAQRNPRYDVDLSSKPAERAAAFRYSPFHHHRDWANGCRARITFLGLRLRSTPDFTLPPAPQAEDANIHSAQKFG